MELMESFFSILAGLEAEIFYVREGHVNHYAMSFTVPVPASLDGIEFSWQSLVKESVSLKI